MPAGGSEVEGEGVRFSSLFLYSAMITAGLAVFL
jgi:hypothetical protein